MPDNLAKRHSAEKRFKAYGLGALLLAAGFLVFLLYTIIAQGYSAFTQTEIALNISFPAEMESFNGTEAVRESLKARFPEVTEPRDRLKLYGLISKFAGNALAADARAHPEWAGTQQRIWLTASSDADMLAKGKAEATEKAAYYHALKEEGGVRRAFNRNFFTRADSREPEQAGILGSLVGSLLTVLVCLLLAFPLGVMAAIYLEEFAPKNKWTDLIEVNINNLAAVPSIVFGLLGLAIYLQFFGLPRSASLVGGLTLALLVLPTIVIAARTSLKAVPPSIRDAARGLGASPMQVTFHHVVPLAMPGIMTGTILAVARALGETAPLIMIGMVAFVADVPRHALDPATVMPVQIYLWSDSPEMGFRERTSAAILVLLGILLVFNGIAAYIRKKYEKTW